jgi:hypothetical protein
LVAVGEADPIPPEAVVQVVLEADTLQFWQPINRSPSVPAVSADPQVAAGRTEEIHQHLVSSQVVEREQQEMAGIQALLKTDSVEPVGR